MTQTISNTHIFASEALASVPTFDGAQAPRAFSTSQSAAFTPPEQVSYDLRTGKTVTLAMPIYDTGKDDPELGMQWQLGYLGDMVKIWEDFTGKGVRYAPLDNGVQVDHWDLAANYDADNSLVLDGQVHSGANYWGDHGTAATGLVVAARNGLGGVGVAYGASFTPVNVYDWSGPTNVDGWNFVAVLKAAASQYDVINCSYIRPDHYAIATYNSRSQGGWASGYNEGYAYLADHGRDGLGTITVKPAGNFSWDAQHDSSNTSRYLINAAAYRQADGVSSSWCNYGPVLLISAPSSDRLFVGGTGLVTTDMVGGEGYNWWDNLADDEPNLAKSDYTNAFGGTSGSGPIIAGVAALMLDANDQLGWRDVRTIFAQSAKMPIAFETGPVSYIGEYNGRMYNVSLNERYFTIGGQAANVNGAGLHYSNDYGYGAVDAYAAVRMAEVWSLFGPAKTSANEMHAAVETKVGITALGDPASVVGDPSYVAGDRRAVSDFVDDPVRFSFEVTDAMDVENIDLTLRFTCRVKVQDADGNILDNYLSDMSMTQFKLIAPDGTEMFTAQPGNRGWVDGSQEFTFGLANFQGVESKGTWTIEVATYAQNGDRDGRPVIITTDVTIESLKMDLYGAPRTNDNVYSYTNEFFTMAAIAGESDRAVLSDKNGGNDWINAAAVSADVVLDLGTTGGASFGGTRAFSIQRGTVIENAVTGDGNDKVTGNAGANKLYGMRGDDKLYGLAGNDTIDGGAGNDWIDGGKGNDIVTGGAGNDVFFFDNKGTSGFDRITDFSAGDKLMLTAALRDSNRDGIITFGRDGILNLDKSSRGDKLLLNGVDPDSGLKFAGMENGYYVYVLNVPDIAGEG